jgi:hypothetical protein
VPARFTEALNNNSLATLSKRLMMLTTSPKERKRLSLTICFSDSREVFSLTPLLKITVGRDTILSVIFVLIFKPVAGCIG